MSISLPINKSYHHGDLRNALIEAGVKMLAEEGEQNFSMRKLARAAGVSHNAPYMHFADKEALLVAIAEEGFTLLSLAVSEAIEQGEDNWNASLKKCCWAYVQFALAHPSHLNLMFYPYNAEKYPGYYKVSTNTLKLLWEFVEAGQEAGLVKAGDSKVLATLIWSLMHGVSTILAGRKMPPWVMGERTTAVLVEEFAAHLYHGLVASIE